jgi:hypothetical protein
VSAIAITGRSSAASVKPAIFLDPARFATDDHAGFLLAHDAEGDAIAIGRAGSEGDAVALTALLRAPGGLPLDPADLVPASALGIAAASDPDAKRPGPAA